MSIFSEQLERIIEKRKRLDELKARSPELEEAIRLAEDYQAEYLELLERCKQSQPQIVPMPYPVYPAQPVYPWQPTYKITMSSGTVHQLPEPAHRVIS